MSSSTTSKFLKHLKSIKSFLNSNSSKSFNIVIGNEACDIDTAACTICYSYYLKEIRKIDTVPVFNLEKSNFKLKTESIFLFEKLGIYSEDLVFVDDIINCMDGGLNSLDFKLGTFLVDCNEYAGPLSKAGNASARDEQLITVKNILDHHQNQSKNFTTLEALINSLEDKENSEVCVGLGSCATLILEKIIKERSKFDEASFEQMVKLLISAVTQDTTNFNANVGNLAERDLIIKTQVEKLNLNFSNWPTFEQVSNAKYNFTGFSVFDCLRRDSKFTDATKSVIIGAIPCSLEELKNLEKDLELSKSLEKIAIDNQFKQIYMISKIFKEKEESQVEAGGEETASRLANEESGSGHIPKLFREVIIYPKMDQNLEKYLMADKNLQFVNVGSDELEYSYLKYFNMKITRKYVLPVVTKYYE